MLKTVSRLSGASKSITYTTTRAFGIDPSQMMLKNDQPLRTPLNKILDRTAEAFFMTEIFKGLWYEMVLMMCLYRCVCVDVLSVYIYI
jgi:hypothetical protein